jgi:hypothetical protein
MSKRQMSKRERRVLTATRQREERAERNQVWAKFSELPVRPLSSFRPTPPASGPVNLAPLLRRFA